MRIVRFGPQADKVVEGFPKRVRIQLLECLKRLMDGQRLTLPLSRPMPVVKTGVSELRLRDASGSYRVFYYLKSEAEILVFHAFQKKTQKTPHQEIETARVRLNRMLIEVVK